MRAGACEPPVKRFKNFSAQEMYDVVEQNVFPFIRGLGAEMPAGFGKPRVIPRDFGEHAVPVLRLERRGDGGKGIVVIEHVSL